MSAQNVTNLYFSKRYYMEQYIHVSMAALMQGINNE